MPKFYVNVLVNYCGEVEADSQDEAEQKGFDYERQLHHDGVHSIEVEELESDEEEEEEEEE